MTSSDTSLGTSLGTSSGTASKRAATGAMTGLALGDALGFPTEFNDVPSILAKFGPWRELPLLKPAIVSDDTQMTLALGRGLRTAMDRGRSDRRASPGRCARSSSNGSTTRRTTAPPATPV